MEKNNSIRLLYIALFLIISVHSANAREGISQESVSVGEKRLNCPIVDTGQTRCYNNSGEIHYPETGKPFYGQDAQYEGNVMSYRDNGDGTVTDLNTGLVWSKAVDKKK